MVRSGQALLVPQVTGECRWPIHGSKLSSRVMHIRPREVGERHKVDGV